MESKKILHNVSQNIEAGVGEVSKVVGVSQGQLHYWEEGGYIKPVSDDDSGIRRYSLSTLYLIVFIKGQLDKGFTLAAAFERSKDIRIKSKIVRTFLEHTFNDAKIANPDKEYDEVNLGELRTDDGKVYRFRGVVDERSRYIETDE